MKVRYLVLPMILAGVLSAQPGRGFRGGSLTPPTASELLTWEVNSLTKYFGLTTTQVGQVTPIVSAEQSCLTTIPPPSAQTLHENLATAIKTPGGNISGAITALANFQSAQETCRATAAAGIYAILTGSQQAKLGNGLGPLLGGGPHFGPHPGGPRPGAPPPAQ